MASASERAALRRATWTGGVAHSFREVDEHDAEYWLAATREQRIRAVTKLTAEMLAMEGVLDPSPRLQRSVGGTRDAVEFVFVGGYAVAFHGRPRATKDIDI